MAAIVAHIGDVLVGVAVDGAQAGQQVKVTPGIADDHLLLSLLEDPVTGRTETATHTQEREGEHEDGLCTVWTKVKVQLTCGRVIVIVD
eukprot:scaffold8015_cov165-Ochromonas_danica.AAC.29